MARGVERATRKQPLRHPEPLTRVDLRPVREGPLGAVCVQPPPTGQPTQALLHGPQLRLALRLHPHADAHASGGPKVSVVEHVLRIEKKLSRAYYKLLLKIPLHTARMETELLFLYGSPVTQCMRRRPARLAAGTITSRCGETT